MKLYFVSLFLSSTLSAVPFSALSLFTTHKEKVKIFAEIVIEGKKIMIYIQTASIQFIPFVMNCTKVTELIG